MHNPKIVKPNMPTSIKKKKLDKISPFQSIINRFRLAFFIFAIVLCGAYLGIFNYAEKTLEPEIIKAELVEHFQKNIAQNQNAESFHVPPSFDFYKIESAPDFLKDQASSILEEVTLEDREIEFFNYNYQGQTYLLTFNHFFNLPDLESSQNYPLLNILETYESTFITALTAATLLGFVLAVLFSYLASKQIITPLIELKDAVNKDNEKIHELTNLPTEVGVLARAIDEKDTKLRAFLERERLFTADVSHELRTPLTVIMGAADVLDAQLENQEGLQPFAQRIQRIATEAAEQVSALLLLSRSPEKRTSTDGAVCLNAIIHNEMDKLSYLLKQKDVNAQLVAVKEIYTSKPKELVKMLLGNLLKNAYQYTDEGYVTISLEDGCIRIMDTGSGIPEELRQRLFERFTRGMSSLDGSGLGLSIAKRVAEHLGWQLSYEPNGKQGSIFIVHFDNLKSDDDLV